MRPDEYSQHREQQSVSRSEVVYLAYEAYLDEVDAVSTEGTDGIHPFPNASISNLWLYR